jgi:hypothetical protein
LHNHPLTSRARWQRKALAVPAGAAARKTTIYLADGRGLVGRRRARHILDAPVMGQVQRPPTRIVKLRLFGPLRLAGIKAPVRIPVYRFARSCCISSGQALVGYLSLLMLSRMLLVVARG